MKKKRNLFSGNWEFILSVFFLLSICSLEATLRMIPNSFALEGTYFYLRPISNYPYYAALRENTGLTRISGPRFANQFDFDSGYAIEGSYRWLQCEYDIRGRWMHFASVTDASLPLGVYSSTEDAFRLTSTSVPHDRRSLSYDACDLLLGYSFFDGLSILTCNFGLHWAKISLSNEYHFFNVTATSDSANGNIESDMHGIGPEVSLMGKWLLPFSWNTWFFLNGKLEGALLFSRINSSRNTFTEQPINIPLIADISNAHVTSVVPHWAFSLSLSSECDFHFHLSAELGYTIIGYYHALDFIAFNRNLFAAPIVTVNTFDRRDSIYFHGLFVTIGIAY